MAHLPESHPQGEILLSTRIDTNKLLGNDQLEAMLRLASNGFTGIVSERSLALRRRLRSVRWLSANAVTSPWRLPLLASLKALS